MPAMDVFDSNAGAFNQRALTATVNKLPYVPGQVSSLGLFEEKGVPVTRISVERAGASLALVPTSPRGAPGLQNNADKRSLVDLDIPHMQLNDTVNAEELQNVRAYGDESQLKTVQDALNEKMRRMAGNLDATLEHQRLGALKGQVLDADGSTVLFDYFTSFNESAPSDVDFDLDNATPAGGALRGKCSEVVRTIAQTLGGLRWSGIHAFCGSTFFDQFVAHAEFRETHVQQEASVLRAGVPYTTFRFGGITFEEYRGPTGTPGYTGPTFLAATEARFIPVGVPDLFITRFAPADYISTVNTMGLPRYADQHVDGSAPNKRRILEVQSNPIHICTRPRVLVKGLNT